MLGCLPGSEARGEMCVIVGEKNNVNSNGYNNSSNRNNINNNAHINIHNINCNQYFGKMIPIKFSLGTLPTSGVKTYIILCDVLSKSPDHDSVVWRLRLVICSLIFITVRRGKRNMCDIPVRTIREKFQFHLQQLDLLKKRNLSEQIFDQRVSILLSSHLKEY